MENNKISIRIASDVDYEHVVAELYYCDEFVAMISQEEGLDNLKIEFHYDRISSEQAIVKIDLDYFKKAIDYAVKKLKDELTSDAIHSDPEKQSRAG